MYDNGRLSGRYSEMNNERGSSLNSTPPISRGSNRISVREADMYNYDFKDKWEGKKEAGMPKKYTKYDENGYRVDRRLKNEKYGDSDPMDDSAFDSKYNSVDKDWIDVKSNNYFSNEEMHKEVGQAAASRPGSGGGGGAAKAWFVEV